MRIKLYIEKREGESWRDASRAFCSWLDKQVKLTTFSILETDCILDEKSGIQFFGFDLKEDYSAYIPYFVEWALNESRVYGRANAGEVSLSNGEIIKLPEEPKIELPEWVNT